MSRIKLQLSQQRDAHAPLLCPCATITISLIRVQVLKSFSFLLLTSALLPVYIKLYQLPFFARSGILVSLKTNKYFRS